MHHHYAKPWKLFFVCALILFVGRESVAVGSDPATPRFLDRSQASGLDFRHDDGGGDQQYLYQLMVAGLATFDFDGDGWLDVMFLNGNDLDDPKRWKSSHVLYRNRGNGSFQLVSKQARIDFPGYGLGVAVADYNNDGFPDVLVNHYRGAKLYENCGDGSFVEVKAIELLTQGAKFGAGVGFLDIESDGDLDLYLACYIGFSVERHRQLIPKSFPYPPGPSDYPPQPDILLRNDGDGRFTDISLASGIASHPGPSMGLVCVDLDQDRDTDIFVCGDARPNQFFRNDGKGVFSEVASETGLAFDLLGHSNGSMGVDCGDVNGDGLLDLVVTNYSGQMPVWYRAKGDGIFEDASRSARLGRDVFVHTNWGVGMADFENDGDQDLVLANGHFLKNIERVDDRTSYKALNSVLVNQDKGRFVAMEPAQGLALVHSSRGLAIDDMDNDGDIDIVVLNANDACNYLENQTVSIGNWLQLELIGVQANRAAVGAVVTVKAGGQSRIAPVLAGRGYQSHFGSRLHIGLHHIQQVDEVRVDWPGGDVEVYRNIPINRRSQIVQGRSAHP